MPCVGGLLRSRTWSATYSATSPPMPRTMGPMRGDRQTEAATRTGGLAPIAPRVSRTRWSAGIVEHLRVAGAPLVEVVALAGVHRAVRTGLAVDLGRAPAAPVHLPRVLGRRPWARWSEAHLDRLLVVGR